MKLHEIRSNQGDPLLYDILHQRLGKKERVEFWAWDGSEEAHGQLVVLEKDDSDKPPAYLFHYRDQRSHDRELQVMGFIAQDLEDATIQKVGDEWHVSIPKPKKEAK
jgi:hypothetical protein